MNESLGESNLILIRKYKSGDKSAKSKLVNINSPLVMSIVKRFIGRGYDKDDIFQIGCIGLIKAIENFNSDIGVQFSTYAVPMILGEIRRFVRDDGPVKVSRSIKENIFKIKKAQESLAAKLNRDATISELTDVTSLSKEDILIAMDAQRPTESLFAKIGSDESGNMFLMDKIKSPHPSPEVEQLDRIALKYALESLNDNERKIVILRYFKGKTQTDVSKVMGISQVQVSRVEKKILKKLRNLIDEENI